MAKGRVIMITAMAEVTPILHIVTIMMIITLTTETVVTITLAVDTIISGLSITPCPLQNAAC
ncbi:MAG: hypothetical protein Q8L15_00375 [Methylobacter sp.]|nr:hypothetical protein [Methylobacter sp.]